MLVIERQRLEKAFKDKERELNTGDIKTMDKVIKSSSEITVDKDKKCVYALMGMHVYRVNNRALVYAVEESLEEKEVDEGNNSYIKELSLSDKRINSKN